MERIEALARALTREDYMMGTGFHDETMSRDEIVVKKVESRWGERYERAKALIIYMDSIDKDVTDYNEYRQLASEMVSVQHHSIERENDTLHLLAEEGASAIIKLIKLLAEAEEKIKGLTTK